MLMKTILDRLQAMERLMPSLVTVTYPDGTQTAVEALKAFEIAVNNRNAIQGKRNIGFKKNTLHNTVKVNIEKHSLA